MSRHVAVVGLPELAAALDRAADKARTAAEAAVAEEVESVRQDARATAPADTGELRAGIVGSARGPRGEVRSTARHATFVEHGTYKDPAQPYMAPAAERSRRRFAARAGARIRAALEGR